MSRHHSPCSKNCREITKLIDVRLKPASVIHRYRPTLIDTIAFVTVVLLSERPKFGRLWRPERRGGFGTCGADCVARGSGGGSCGGGKLTRLSVQS